MALSPDGNRLATLEYSGPVRVWETSSGRELYQLRHEARGANDVAASPDGAYFATVADDRTVRLWDAATGRELFREPHPDSSSPGIVVFSGDGKYLATARSTIRVWEVPSGRAVASIDARIDDAKKLGGVRGLALSRDGRYLITIRNTSGSRSQSGTTAVRSWETASARPLTEIRDEATLNPNGVAFSADGSKLATASRDMHARVWEAASAHQLHRLPHDDAVRAVDFSSDGRLLATGSDDKTARIWDLSTGRALSRMSHQSPVYRTAFSADERYLATMAGGAVHLWDVSTGRELSRISIGADQAAFSVDNRYLATRGSGYAVWLLRPDDLVQDACARLSRNLTRDEWRYFIGEELYRKTCPSLQ